MKQRLLPIVCVIAALTIVPTVKGYQLGPLEKELQVWIQQAHPVDASAIQSDYDPTKVSVEKIRTLELTVNDKKRQRDIPLLVYLPKQTKAAEVIVHSHGLGGSRETSSFLGQHWAARGYVAVFTQHPGSDIFIWQDVAPVKRRRALKKAANTENFKLRVADVPTVIDQLEQWNRQTDHPLHSRMNLKQIGMSGHSFGATTTQHVGGQASSGKAAYQDKRIKACIPMSPSVTRIGNANRAFGKITLPWLCMTGSHDKSVIGSFPVENRLAVYDSLPPKDKYELVLFEAEHSAFTEPRKNAKQAKRNPNHHRAIKATSTAFWDAYLRGDPQAKKWLTTDSVRSALATKDRWQHK